MQMQQADNNVIDPSQAYMIPMDGGMSLAGGIPAFDPRLATQAYGQAPKLIDQTSPVPEAAPAPFEAPTPDLGTNDETYDFSPKPRGFA